MDKFYIDDHLPATQQALFDSAPAKVEKQPKRSHEVENRVKWGKECSETMGRACQFEWHQAEAELKHPSRQENHLQWCCKIHMRK